MCSFSSILLRPGIFCFDLMNALRDLCFPARVCLFIIYKGLRFCQGESQFIIKTRFPARFRLIVVRLINIILGENDNFLREREACVLPGEKQKTITYLVPDKFKDDINALVAYVGDECFHSGLHIDVSLGELLRIIPRKRRRTDAYDALVAYLKNERNIILTIKSNRQ